MEIDQSLGWLTIALMIFVALSAQFLDARDEEKKDK